ncbi:MAG TPA: hypothetical protein PK640_07090, partial [Verrucomicrobiota bacterium]|nr:hypothetical protein [Verrucomicrobiota bacterium]
IRVVVEGLGGRVRGSQSLDTGGQAGGGQCGVFQELTACPGILVHGTAVVVHGVGKTMSIGNRQSKPPLSLVVQL